MPADRDASLDPDRIRAIGFSTALRGYDQHEVRRYLERLAEALRARRAADGSAVARAERRAVELERRAAELQATVDHLRGQLDSRASAGVAEPAEDEAVVPTVPHAVQGEVERLVGEARQEAERIVALATEQAAQAMAAADEHAERVVAAATERAAQIVAAAAASGRTGPDRGRLEVVPQVEAHVEEVEVEVEVDVESEIESEVEADVESEVESEVEGGASRLVPRRPAPGEPGPARVPSPAGDQQLVEALAAARDQLDRAMDLLQRSAADPATDVAGPAEVPRRGVPADDHQGGDDRDGTDGAAPPLRLPTAGAAALDALFSKVRADRTRAVADARQLLGGAEARRAASTPDAGPVDGAPPSEPSWSVAPPIDSAFLARDEALAPLEQQALRGLKRAMADAQSEVLDVVGRSPGPISADRLPDPRDQRRRYRDAAAGAVLAALRSGAAAGGGRVHDRTAEVLCDTLADRVAEPLQAALAAALASTVDQPDAVLDRIRAAYRSFRARELPTVVADILAEAFAVGLHRSHPTGTRFTWTPDPRQPLEADCAGNAEAGPFTASDRFPSGHRGPPAGPGCRCLALPTPG